MKWAKWNRNVNYGALKYFFEPFLFHNLEYHLISKIGPLAEIEISLGNVYCLKIHLVLLENSDRRRDTVKYAPHFNITFSLDVFNTYLKFVSKLLYLIYYVQQSM